MKKLVGIILFVLIIGIGFYFPKSLSKIIDYESLNHVSITLVKPNIDEQGSAINHIYQLDLQDSSQLISILETTKFQSKLRNILPFEFDVSNQDMNYTITMNFYDENESQTVFFLGDERIWVDPNMYHMIQIDTIDKIAEYVMKNGELKK